MKILKTANYKKFAELDLNNLFTGDKQSPPVKVPKEYEPMLDEGFQTNEEKMYEQPFEKTPMPWDGVKIDGWKKPSPEDELKMNELKSKGYKVSDWIDGVTIISIIDWLEVHHPNWLKENIPYEQLTKEIDAWCAMNDGVGYAAPRESFSHYDAAQQAKYEGKTLAVVEDLS